jgi:hypothetical protein
VSGPAWEVWDWPALANGQVPRRLAVERAVWGKVHGASSDFRWIARSQGIDPQARRLERELLLGFEDAPERAACWRALAGSFCAFSCYPSQAIDAARRSGFLEKQLLEWRPLDGVPAALAALLLLPRVAELEEQLGWKLSDRPEWARSDFSLLLEPESVEVTEKKARENAIAGLADLREAVGEESRLAALYSALQPGGQRPAILGGLRRPLRPEGVAALLLPLSRDRADRLSLAGWLPSKQVDAESFRRLWDVLACDQPPAGLRAPVEITDEGREAARAVFESDPARLPGRSRAQGAPAVKAQLPSVIERLYDFAADESWRWLAPEALAGGPGRLLRMVKGCENDLREYVESLQGEVEKIDERKDPWRRKHLQAKADLLRAAALALAPATFMDLGLPRSTRVPALLYCCRLAEQDWSQLAPLGGARFRKIVEQSLGCRPDLFGREIRDWLSRAGLPQ